MRISYLINSMEGGGAQTPLPKIIRSLEQAGASVQLLALTRRNGLAIERLRAQGVDPIVRDGGEHDHLQAYNWIVKMVREWRSDVIWTSLTRSTLLGQLAGQRLGLPVISWQHNAFLKPWNERLLRWRSRAADLWIADSQQVAVLTRDRLSIPEQKLITWPIFAADPDAPRAAAWQSGTPLRLGTLGRLHPNKGYDILIEAVSILESGTMRPQFPFRIVIAGTGPDEAKLREMVRAKGLQTIEFAGFADQPEQFLAGLHLYLQPSRREGFCIAAHEAMQAGLPVIVSRTGEMPYTVSSPDLGRVVEVADAPSLAGALAELLSAPEKLSAMGHAARARVLERFSQAKFDAIGADIVRRIASSVSQR